MGLIVILCASETRATDHESQSVIQSAADTDVPEHSSSKKEENAASESIETLPEVSVREVKSNAPDTGVHHTLSITTITRDQL